MSCTDPGLSVYIDDPVGQGATSLLTGYLTDEAGDDLPLLDLQTLTLTLTDVVTGAIINSRSAQNVKNTNGGTVVTAVVNGVTRLKFTILLSALDNVILDFAATREPHVAALTWGYDTDRIGKVDVTFVVARL